MTLKAFKRDSKAKAKALGHRSVALLRREHQRRAAVASARLLHRGPGGQEPIDDGHVAFLGGQDERRGTVAAGQLRRGLAGEQQFKQRLGAIALIIEKYMIIHAYIYYDILCNVLLLCNMYIKCMNICDSRGT